MYSLDAYGRMLSDGVRFAAYLEALENALPPGGLVVEIGTGPGILALAAARRGARKVYALEPDDVIEVARQLVVANRLEGVIELRQALSTDVELPERADLVVSDLRGILPLLGHHIPAIVDARQRFLAPGGVLIPRLDRLWAALVEGEELYRRQTSGFQGEGLDLDLRLARRLATNTVIPARLAAEQCLAEAQCWAELDYRTIVSPDVRGRLGWQIAQPARAHGVAIWFDTELHDGIGFSTAPGQPERVYGQALLPFSHPLDLAAGDRVEVELQAALVGDGYVWRWNTRRSGSGDESFAQSTFDGGVISPEKLRKRSSAYAPRLDEEGRITAFVLAQMDGRRDLESIARRLQEAFPDRFPDLREALTRAGELSLEFG